MKSRFRLTCENTPIASATAIAVENTAAKRRAVRLKRGSGRRWKRPRGRSVAVADGDDDDDDDDDDDGNDDEEDDEEDEEDVGIDAEVGTVDGEGGAAMR